MRIESPHIRSLIAMLDEFVMMTLAMLSGVLVFREMLFPTTPYQQFIFTRIDQIIALVFLIEFYVRLHLSVNRIQFLKKYWWEMFAAIPISNEVTQALRVLRLLRIFRFAIHFGRFWRKGGDAPEYKIT